jgi:hypothetical protein
MQIRTLAIILLATASFVPAAGAMAAPELGPRSDGGGTTAASPQDDLRSPDSRGHAAAPPGSDLRSPDTRVHVVVPAVSDAPQALEDGTGGAGISVLVLIAIAGAMFVAGMFAAPVRRRPAAH